VRHMPMVDLLYSSKVAMAAATCKEQTSAHLRKRKRRPPVPLSMRCGLADEFVGGDSRRIGGERRKGSTESGRVPIPHSHLTLSRDTVIKRKYTGGRNQS
jgi:hypothetical protein